MMYQEITIDEHEYEGCYYSFTANVYYKESNCKGSAFAPPVSEIIVKRVELTSPLSGYVWADGEEFIVQDLIQISLILDSVYWEDFIK